MEFNIIARHFDLTPSIADYADKKIRTAVKKFHPGIISVHVVLSVEKKYIHAVEIVATAPHAKFLAKGKTIDLYAAIDLTVDKLQKQLKKYKERLKDHKRVAAKDIYRANINVVAPEGSDILDRKSFKIMALSPEEAIDNMLDSDYNFYVFKNILTGDLNVAYKRGDETYGLIELRQ